MTINIKRNFIKQHSFIYCYIDCYDLCLIFNSNIINGQASFSLDRHDGKTGKGKKWKNQDRGKEKNMVVEYIPLAVYHVLPNMMAYTPHYLWHTLLLRSR